MLSTPMTSRRRMPTASSWKLSATLRRKKSLGSMPSPAFARAGPPPSRGQALEPVDVGVVERRVDLVQDADRRRVCQEGGEEQGEGGQRLLAARQQRQGLQLLARRARHDFEPGGERVVIVDQTQLRLAAAEQLCEKLHEVAVELLEGPRRPPAHLPVERRAAL